MMPKWETVSNKNVVANADAMLQKDKSNSNYAIFPNRKPFHPIIQDNVRKSAKEFSG